MSRIEVEKNSRQSDEGVEGKVLLPIPGVQAVVVGGGMAGSECAWQLARRGWRVALVEMRPYRYSPAHTSEFLGELVCSNSLKSEDPTTAHGLLKEELNHLDSLILRIAQKHRVPAGSALAVERNAFSAEVTRTLAEEPLVEVIRGEVVDLPHPVGAQSDLGLAGPESGPGPGPGPLPIVVATGPLTSEALASQLWSIMERRGDGGPAANANAGANTNAGAPPMDAGTSHQSSSPLYFYDAIAPIIDGDSIDMTVAFAASRYGKGGADYLNCPLNEQEYQNFLDALRTAQRVEPHDFEEPRYFQGCQPIEALADTGDRTLTFGPMKPVGLIDPRTGERPWAVVQLRREDEAGTAWNMVGFQTKLRYPEQERVFRLIPGLSEARFLRFGSIHRNTYINAPSLLSRDLSIAVRPDLFIAGQLCGVEGYVESVAMGLLVALSVDARLRRTRFIPPPPETALGALCRHLATSPPRGTFQPTAIHFGLFPALLRRVPKRERGSAYAARARTAFAAWFRQ